MAEKFLFISYPSDDAVIAMALYEAIKAMPDRALEPFQDRADPNISDAGFVSYRSQRKHAR